MKKMTKRLACLVLVLVMACCALPGVTYGATLASHRRYSSVER